MKKVGLFFAVLVLLGVSLLFVDKVIVGGKNIELVSPLFKVRKDYRYTRNVLLDRHVLGQTFRARYKRLYALGVKTEPLGLPESATVELRLYGNVSGDGSSISNEQLEPIPLRSLHYRAMSPDGWHTFQFQPIRLEIGRYYYFSFKVTNVPKEYKIRWRGYSTDFFYHGDAFIDGKKQGGDFVFQVSYAIPLKNLFVEFLKGDTFYKPVLPAWVLLVSSLVLVFIFGWLCEKTLEFL